MNPGARERRAVQLARALEAAQAVAYFEPCSPRTCVAVEAGIAAVLRSFAGHGSIPHVKAWIRPMSGELLVTFGHPFTGESITTIDALLDLLERPPEPAN